MRIWRSWPTGHGTRMGFSAPVWVWLLLIPLYVGAALIALIIAGCMALIDWADDRRAAASR